MDGPKVRKKSLSRRGKPIAHALEYLAFRLVGAILRALPVDGASAAMGWLWRKIGPRTRRHERVGRNLALALPALGPAEHARIAAAQWDNLGRTFAESFLLDRVYADAARISLTLAPELDARLRAMKQGAVLVSMHSANWELTGYPFRRYRTMVGLYRRFSNPLTNDYVRKVRMLSFEAGMLPKGPDTAQAVMRAVRAGTSVGILADLREGRGIAVRFFGHETTANPFPAMVARRLGTVLVAVRVKRREGARFDIEAVEVPVPSTVSYTADVKAATQALLDVFETWIRERPGEWMWVQDRWRPPRAAPAGAAEGQALSDPEALT